MNDFLPGEICPVRNILDRIGDKWSLLVLLTLESNGTMRFGEVHKTIGDISHRMLTVTLRNLEADGFVQRKVFPEIPPKVEYKLTELAQSLIPCINKLVEWALENSTTVISSRASAGQSNLSA